VGAVLVVADRILQGLVAPPLVNFMLLAILVLLSGGLHLDGLIDTADGLFERGPAEHRLASMRESWAGHRGVAAALTQIMLQYAAISALPGELRTTALLLAPTLGRWAVVYGYVSFPYARRTAGLSLALKLGATPAAGIAATLVALLTTSLLFGPHGLLLLAVTWLLATAAGLFANKRLGGMSGDVYGAVEQVVETTTLLLVPVLAGFTSWGRSG
jgi:adenosylcobinamide-GDP ribazoletransferase